MEKITFHKLVSALPLPASLKKNALYFVQKTHGVIAYITNRNGTIVARNIVPEVHHKTYSATTNGSGEWSLNLTGEGWTDIQNIIPVALSTTDALNGQKWATLNAGYTNTAASGQVLASTLFGVLHLSGSGVIVKITVIGKR